MSWYGITRVVVMAPGGNMTTLATVPRNIMSLAYNRSADLSTNMLYYCSTANKLYKYNVNNSTETAITLPVSTISCTGRGMLYNTTNSSLIFPYVHTNGLYGVAELFNP